MCKQFGLGAVLGAMVVLGAWAVFHFWFPQVPPLPDASEIRFPDGNYVVRFTALTSKTPSSESWAGMEIQDVVAIDFHPGFFVVKMKQGGTVLFLDRIKDLSWEPKTTKVTGGTSPAINSGLPSRAP